MESKPLMMMTSDEVLELADRIIARLPKATKVETATINPVTHDKVLPEYVIGWTGLAKLFGISVNTARERIKTGALEGACKMQDGKLITNAALAIRLWSEYKDKDV